jgi:hypothetical protein
MMSGIKRLEEALGMPVMVALASGPYSAGIRGGDEQGEWNVSLYTRAPRGDEMYDDLDPFDTVSFKSERLRMNFVKKLQKAGVKVESDG